MHRYSDSRHRLVVLALERVVAFDLAIPLQVFASSGLNALYEVVVAGPSPGPRETSSGLIVLVEHGLEAIAEADTVIIPGFDFESELPQPVVRALRSAHESGARLASICTGAFALAATGLLDGLSATTHWLHAERLAERHPSVMVDADVLYIDHGSLSTSAGLTAGLDLSLHLVEQDCGPDAALAVSRRLVMSRHRAGGQAQFRPGPLRDGDGVVAETLNWAARNLTEDHTVATLAARANVSARTFHRRCVEQTGHPPGEWLGRERVTAACRILENPALPVTSIARDTGFGTAANMRAWFAKVLSTTPSAYRRAFASR